MRGGAVGSSLGSYPKGRRFESDLRVMFSVLLDQPLGIPSGGFVLYIRQHL